MSALYPEPHLALIVEDDPDVRALAGALLEEIPLEVVEVDSAEAALDCLQERGGEVGGANGLGWIRSADRMA